MIQGVEDPRAALVVNQLPLSAGEIFQDAATQSRKLGLNQEKVRLLLHRWEAITNAITQQNQNSPQLCVPSASNRLVRDFDSIRAFIVNLAQLGFVRSLLRRDDIFERIRENHVRLTYCLDLFQVSASPELMHYMANLAQAHVADADSLSRQFANLDDEQVLKSLGVDNNPKEAMLALYQHLEKHSDESAECQILKRALLALRRSIPEKFELQPWIITSYDVDIDHDHLLGQGGFGAVKRGRWGNLVVAVKVMGSGTQLKLLQSEIAVWNPLRHDHILPFYGGSLYADPPFLVSQYMQNGNVVGFLKKHPNADRVRLVHQVGLGMLYIHEKGIVHGDLKGLNVLIDDSFQARITDFGLSKIKGNSLVSKTAAYLSNNQTSGDGAGTQRWMSPEAMDGSVSKTSDVYAYAITLFEIFTDELPFKDIPDRGLIYSICILKKRLSKPTSQQVVDRGLTSRMWALICEASEYEPSARPKFNAICARTSDLLEEWKEDHPTPAPAAQTTSAQDTQAVGDILGGVSVEDHLTRLALAPSVGKEGDVQPEAAHIGREISAGDIAGRLALSDSLLTLAGIQANSGSTTEAIDTMKEAVAINRSIVAEDSTKRPALAISLDKLAGLLHRLGRHKEAVQAGKEVVAISRTIAEGDPGGRPTLAGYLVGYSGVLVGMGRNDEAVEAVEEAVSIRRSIAIEDSKGTSAVVTSLIALAGVLSSMGRAKEVVDAMEEAISINRLVVEKDSAGRPALAKSLDSFAAFLNRMGRNEEAIEAGKEVVSINRSIAMDDAAGKPGLAVALDGFSGILGRMGRQAEALQAAEEAIDLHRSISTLDPAGQPALVTSLVSLAVALSGVGRNDEAVDAMKEAVTTNRSIALRDMTQRPALAMSLDRLAGLLNRLGRNTEAVQLGQEVVSIHRSITAEGKAGIPALALSLEGLGGILGRMGRYDEALELSEEAVTIYRSIAAEDLAGRPALSLSLDRLAALLNRMGRNEAALRAGKESVSIRRLVALGR